MAGNHSKSTSVSGYSVFSPQSLSRLGSLASQIDADQVNQALDAIHQTASRSDGLTTFNDFASPPSPSSESGKPKKSALDGLYNRFKASVGPQQERSPTRTKRDSFSALKGPLDTSKSETRTPSETRPEPSNSLNKYKEASDINRKRPSSPLVTKTEQEPSTLAGNVTTSKTTGPVRNSNKRLRTSASGATIQSLERQSEDGLQAPTFSTHAESESTSAAIRANVREVHQPVPQPKPTSQLVEASLKPSVETRAASHSSETTPPIKEPDTPISRESTALLPPPALMSTKSEQTQRSRQNSKIHGPRMSRADSSNGTEAASEISMPAPSRAKVATTSQHVFAQTVGTSQTPAPNALVYQMSQKILSRDFWLKDENAKSCFNCGDGFTTFRRKHHCRLCGQIYCNSCTNLISGRPFGQSSKLRVCKTCNLMLHEDDSPSDYSEGEDGGSTPQVKQIRFSDVPTRSSHSPERRGDDKHSALYKNPAFNSSNSALRRAHEHRRSSIPGGDSLPILSRPSSSRSLRALSARPKSSSNRTRRPRSQHQHMRSLSIGPENGQVLSLAGDKDVDQTLPAFHTNSVIDPELEPFLSDDGSSDDDTPNIASTMTGDTPPSPGAGLQSILNALKKARPRTPLLPIRGNLERPMTREFDTASVTSMRGGQARRSGGRTLSMGSISHFGGSRVGKSDNLLKNTDNLYAMIDKADPLGIALRDERRPSTQAECSPDSDKEPKSAELNPASLTHLRRILRQFLQDKHIENPGRWEKALTPVLLLCAGTVEPDITRGDNIDIRDYIKIKKIPVGAPSDTTCISGIVFTKTIALKDMSRSVKNPRVLLISFPLIYARHQQHFMSLEGVMAQEHEYLRNLSTRIKALRPGLLLVQGDISGLMKGFLHESDIITVYNVKPSVLQAVARCTQTRVVSSVDKLTMDPNLLGICSDFEVKTFVDKGFKKSFIYISGCKPDLGCTVVLHGADERTLRKLKPVVDFLCYVTYSLRLETCLMRDQFASVMAVSEGKSNEGKLVLKKEKLQDPRKAPDLDGSYKDMALDLETRILSTSPSVALPQPYLLQRGKDEEILMERLRDLQQFKAPESPTGKDDDEDKKAPAAKFELIRQEMIYDSATNTSKQVREILRAIHKAEYQKASDTYNAIRRRWDVYTSDVVEPFSPLSHQKILVLFSIVSNPTADACIGPDLLGFEFYQENDIQEGFERDIPLGEYIERLCTQSHSPCTAGRCERKMIDHHRQYVHGDGQLTVHVEKCPPRVTGMEKTILMWSRCKQCDFESHVAPMSQETWRYSFAKYLELSFWNKSMHPHPRVEICPHDIHREHTRFFGYKNMLVRVEYEPITLVEVIVPKSTIAWVVEKDLRLKNDQYQRIEGRIGRYMSSVKHRLKNMKLESIEEEKLDECKARIQDLTKKANEQYESLTRKLQDQYMMSKYFEMVPLNRAVMALQDTVVEWDTIFGDLESEYFPSEKDLRKLAAIQFRKTFLEKEESSIPSPDDESKEKSQIEQGSSDVLNEKAGLVDGAEQDVSKVVTVNSGAGALKKSEDDQLTSPTQSTQVVQSLDLAFPVALMDSVSPTSSNDQSKVSSHLSPTTSADGIQVVEAQNPLPLSEEIASRVEAMSLEDAMQNVNSPSKSNPSNHDEEQAHQRTSIVAPQLFRSQTQPLLPTQSTASSKTRAKEELLSQVRDSQGPTLQEMVEEAAAAAAAASYPPISPSSPAMRAADRARQTATRMAKSAVQSMIPRPLNSKRYDTKVSALAKHFEQMSREFEKEKLRERRLRNARTRQSKAFPTSSANPILEVFRDANEAVRERELPRGPVATSALVEEAVSPTLVAVDADKTNLNDDAAGNGPYDALSTQEHTADESEENTLVRSYPESAIDGITSDGELGTIADSQETEEDRSQEPPEFPIEMAKHERNSLLKLLSSLWSERSASGWTQLEYPFAPTDHLFADSDLIIREDEPSSLIAFSLASADYNGKIQKFREQSNAAEQARRAPGSSDDFGVESVMLGKTATHMRYNIEDGSAKMQCKIFYAESFDAIRRKCGVADRFGESLSRCVKWDSKGGKTKSLFLKTLDERFVLKSLSQVETTAFLRFAPDYFDFMSKCLFHNLPSALAKMLGLYQVVIRNPMTGTEFNWYLQVMENVFYEGASNRMFDLKGSMRNRRVESTGEQDEVLLDENLLDYIAQTPLYVRSHSNSVLAASISNDTLFCSKQNVMDYSLIVGLYEGRKELLVGIIDYIRTYTWDKRLETWIKDRGKHKATVRSPKEYRTRFRRSIPRYFPHAPSVWQSYGIPRAEQLRLPSAEEIDEEDDEDGGEESEADEDEGGETEDGEDVASPHTSASHGLD